MSNQYEITELRTIKELRDIFDGEESTRNAWLFLSTGGNHGTKITLDDLESILRDESDVTDSINGRYWITALIVYPQEVSGKAGILSFGELFVDIEDIQWLREIVRKTLLEVQISQVGNT